MTDGIKTINVEEKIDKGRREGEGEEGRNKIIRKRKQKRQEVQRERSRGPTLL